MTATSSSFKLVVLSATTEQKIFPSNFQETQKQCRAAAEYKSFLLFDMYQVPD